MIIQCGGISAEEFIKNKCYIIKREREMSLPKPSTATLTIISKSSSTLAFLQAAAPGPSSYPSHAS